MNDRYLQPVEGITEQAAETQDNEKIRISLDSGRDSVHRICYNPDSDAGGQYISGNLDFYVFEELIEQYDIENHPENAEKFFSDLEEMSDRFLADINTPFFLEDESDYETDCNYIEFTPENILSIHKDICRFDADHKAELARMAEQNELDVLPIKGFNEIFSESVYIKAVRKVLTEYRAEVLHVTPYRVISRRNNGITGC